MYKLIVANIGSDIMSGVTTIELTKLNPNVCINDDLGVNRARWNRINKSLHQGG